MKRKTASPYILIGFLWLLIVFLFLYNVYEPKPKIDFAGLEMSNVASIYIIPDSWGDPNLCYSPARLSDEDAAMLLPKLNMVELTGGAERDRNRLKYYTASLMFHITLTDGTAFEFAASTSFYVVNYIGYRSVYAIGDDILYTYYQLHNKYFGTEYTWAKSS